MAMGSKDHRSREAKKPPKKKTPAAVIKKATREDFSQAAFKAVQETIRCSES